MSEKYNKVVEGCLLVTSIVMSALMIAMEVNNIVERNHKLKALIDSKIEE